jgi:hypothetical protein
MFRGAFYQWCFVAACLVQYIPVIRAAQVPPCVSYSDCQSESVADDGLSGWSLGKLPSLNATGHLVFETVNSLLQHWPNTRLRNGRRCTCFFQFAAPSCKCKFQVIRSYQGPFRWEHFYTMGPLATNCRQVPNGPPSILNTLSSSAGMIKPEDVGISHLRQLDHSKWSILMAAVPRRPSGDQWTRRILSLGVCHDPVWHTRNDCGSQPSVNGPKV